MAELTDPAELAAATARYSRAEERFAQLGGWAAESEAARICSNLGLPDRVLATAAQHALRRSAAPGRARPDPVRRVGNRRRRRRRAGSCCCWTSRRTTSTPTPIVWLRDYLRQFSGGLVIISHDVDLLSAVVNKVWFLDARARRARRLQHELAALPAGQGYRRAAPPARARQRREEGVRLARAGGEARRQGHQGHGRASDGAAGGANDRRTRRRAGGRSGRQDPVPAAGALRAHAADRREPLEVLRIARGLHRRAAGHRPGQPGGRARAERRRQDHPAEAARRPRGARHRRSRAGPRVTPRVLRAGTRDHRPGRTVWENTRRAAPDARRAGAAQPAGRLPVPRGAAGPARRHSVRRREDPARTGRRWSRPRRTSCCSTSRPTTSIRRAGSRCWTRCAGTRVRSCW